MQASLRSLFANGWAKRYLRIKGIVFCQFVKFGQRVLPEEKTNKMKTEFEKNFDVTEIDKEILFDSVEVIATLFAKTRYGHIIANLYIQGSDIVKYKGEQYENPAGVPAELFQMLDNWKEEYAKIIDVQRNRKLEMDLIIRTKDCEKCEDYTLADNEDLSSGKKMERLLKRYVKSYIRRVRRERVKEMFNDLLKYSYYGMQNTYSYQTRNRVW